MPNPDVDCTGFLLVQLSLSRDKNQAPTLGARNVTYSASSWILVHENAGQRPKYGTSEKSAPQDSTQFKVVSEVLVPLRVSEMIRHLGALVSFIHNPQLVNTRGRSARNAYSQVKDQTKDKNPVKRTYRE